jgi:hypothetical protein
MTSIENANENAIENAIVSICEESNVQKRDLDIVALLVKLEPMKGQDKKKLKQVDVAKLGGDAKGASLSQFLNNQYIDNRTRDGFFTQQRLQTMLSNLNRLEQRDIIFFLDKLKKQLYPTTQPEAKRLFELMEDKAWERCWLVQPEDDFIESFISFMSTDYNMLGERMIHLFVRNRDDIERSVTALSDRKVPGRDNHLNAYILPQASLFQPFVCFQHAQGDYSTYSLLGDGTAMISPNQWGHLNVKLLLKNMEVSIHKVLDNGAFNSQVMAQAGLSSAQQSLRFGRDPGFVLDLEWDCDKWYCLLKLDGDYPMSDRACLQDMAGAPLFDTPVRKLPRSFTLSAQKLPHDDAGVSDRLRLCMEDGGDE